MASFQRYAVYYLPDDAELAAFGAAWLGWDVEAGRAALQPDIDLALDEITATPRRYGFHGTLKPPFRLADGTTAKQLAGAVDTVARSTPPVTVEGLRLATLGHFLALVPEGDTAALGDLAAACVRDLDSFRAPPSETELARRRAKGLSARQDENLVRWGYPYVLEEFRFHLTLSGSLDPETLAHAQSAAKAHLPPLPRPFRIESISLVGERDDGMFEAIHRYALTG